MGQPSNIDYERSIDRYRPVINLVWDESSSQWVAEASSIDVSASFIQALKDPEFVDRMNMALKVVFPSAQLVTLSGTNTVTTVAAVTTMTQIGAVDAREMVPWANWTMWNETIRSRVT